MSAVVQDVQNFGLGDYIVHCHHGVGRIAATERKNLGGKDTTYFRIEMADSMIWIPVEVMNSGQLRPLVEKAVFQEAIDELSKQSVEMNSNMNLRKLRINQIIDDNEPITTAQLIRDMWARQQVKGTPNESERRAYRAITDRLLQEWALCMEINIQEARELMERSLNEGKNRINKDKSKVG
jgi:RNA polymerase-interacting CarD/CdnL/TRCF family regulator